ncbi:DUF7331 family protein [Haloarcula onubensis]|uniref:Uncharacterized protein n=1 Tax=Haloarcula onubensis TaxID=2950539 RepID=A0ABU2FQ32_9EURY|nr:hypothetical protein [Halomicroarcula sp. S3CR25-11]MDS0282853.1 hypothetical protein [Halomicroarcula sp. S3CR25-11]
MPSRTSDTDDGGTVADPDGFDRYSHVRTDSGEIIYDTERDDAWIQADCALRLTEWR